MTYRISDRTRCTIWFTALVAATVMSGCSPTTKQTAVVTDTSWQQSVQQYMNEHANGDPSFLRTYAVSSAEPGYAIISDTRRDQSTDILGIVLGQRVVNGKVWTLFMRGSVVNQKVTKINVVAMARARGKTQWRVSADQPGVLQQYLAKRPKPSADGRATFRAWPAPTERFNLRVNGTNVAVTDPRSGARWTLTLQ